MAKLDGVLPVTGAVGNLSIYKMRGSDRLIVRRKGGASKKMIQKHPHFDLVRRNNNEFAGCAVAGQYIRAAMAGIRHLKDASYAGALQKICKQIQMEDKAGSLGQRSVLVSLAPYRLEGFSVNKYTSLDQLIRYPIRCELDRLTATATISLPPLQNGISLHNPMKQPFYRCVFMLAAMPDIAYNADRIRYSPILEKYPFPAEVKTEWYNISQGSPASEHVLTLTDWDQSPSISLVLSAGIEFGTPSGNGDINFVKYSGAGKILLVK